MRREGAGVLAVGEGRDEALRGAEPRREQRGVKTLVRNPAWLGGGGAEGGTVRWPCDAGPAGLRSEFRVGKGHLVLFWF